MQAVGRAERVAESRRRAPSPMGEHQIGHVVPTRDRRNTSSSPEAIPGIIPLHGGIEMNAVTQNRPRRFPWFKPEKQSEAEHPHR